MKTEIIMYRDLNGIKVRQNHKTGFFNGNDLLALYNSTAERPKEIHDYLRSKPFREFSNEVLRDIMQNTANSRVSFSGGEDEATVRFDDSLIKIHRGSKGGTWMHPYIFMDFAMWLSPEFKLTCIKWIYDKLIQVRDEAGESFKKVNIALFNKKPNSTPFDYANEAKMINKLVFGTTESGQRNSATEEQLTLLKTLQGADIKLLEENKDYFERFQELLNLKKYL